MASLRSDFDGSIFHLVRDTLVGRAAGCVIQLSDGRVSSRHAAVAWSGGRWEVRDLGSRNGTYVGGRRLESGEAVAIGQDMVVDFGGSGSWTLVDETPPQACARSLDTGALVFMVDGQISLPSAEEPQVIVYEHRSLGWLWEDAEGELEAARHGLVMSVAGGSFRLDLGDTDPTRAAAPAPRRFVDAHLRFTVSMDEEHVDVEACWPGQEFLLQASVHWYTVLLLARQRLADEAQPELPARERGWVYRDELCRQLRTSVSKLNVDLHRLRGLLGRVGVDDPSAMFERRSSTGQLRLGTAKVEIFQAGGTG